MTYPILEYDSTRLAFIEPSQVIQPRDVPEACVICFFQEVIDKVVTVHQAQRLVENRWEDGPHPVYEIVYRGQRLAFFHPGIGAPLAAALLEEVIGFGCRKFIACGGCGVLQPDLAVGHLILVSGAVRDEGVSYHYLPPAREVIATSSRLSISYFAPAWHVSEHELRLTITTVGASGLAVVLREVRVALRIKAVLHRTIVWFALEVAAAPFGRTSTAL